METRRQELLERLETEMDQNQDSVPPALGEWVRLLEERDHLLRQQIEQENQRLLAGHLRRLRDLLVVIGQFDLSHTPRTLNLALGALYRQLRDYVVVEDGEWIPGETPPGVTSMRVTSPGTTSMRVTTTGVTSLEEKSLENTALVLTRDGECQTDGGSQALSVNGLPQVRTSHVTTGGGHVKTASECSDTESNFEVLNSTAQSDCPITHRMEHVENDMSSIRNDTLYCTANDLDVTTEFDVDNYQPEEAFIRNQSVPVLRQGVSAMESATVASPSQTGFQNSEHCSPVLPIQEETIPESSSTPVFYSISPGLDEVADMMADPVSRDSQRPNPEVHFVAGGPTLVSTALQGVVRLPSETSRDEDPDDLESSLSLSID